MESNLDTQKSPEIDKITLEISTLLKDHAENLGNDLKKIDKGNEDFCSIVNPLRRELPQNFNDPTRKSAEEERLNTVSALGSQINRLSNDVEQNNSNNFLKKYYSEIVPKISTLLKSTDKENDSETLNEITTYYQRKQLELERTMQERSNSRRIISNVINDRYYEIDGKNRRMRNSLDNPRLDWSTTNINTLSRQLSRARESGKIIDSKLNSAEENMLKQDSFIVYGKKMEGLINKLLENKYMDTGDI